MSFNAICENKILTKISESIVYLGTCWKCVTIKQGRFLHMVHVLNNRILSCLLLNTMLVFRAGTHMMPVRTAIIENPYNTSLRSNLI